MSDTKPTGPGGYRAGAGLKPAGPKPLNVHLFVTVDADVESAKDLAVLNLRLLLRLGATDPQAEADAETRRRLREGEDEPTRRETPLHLLTSEASQTYARAMREAAEARAIVDRERGIEDGLAELLGDYAAVAELECFGPVGLVRE